MPRKYHKMDRYEALGCMGCLIITITSIILIGFIAWGIVFMHDVKAVLSL